MNFHRLNVNLRTMFEVTTSSLKQTSTVASSKMSACVRLYIFVNDVILHLFCTNIFSLFFNKYMLYAELEVRINETFSVLFC